MTQSGHCALSGALFVATIEVILLTKEEMVAIDDFRFENRMRNRSDAVRALLKLALDRIGEDLAKPP